MTHKAAHPVNIIGHLNPDTDAICSAIALAYLKNTAEKTDRYVPRRAGSVNRETAFVLSHFGIDAPRLITSVSPQIKDVNFHRQEGIAPEISLLDAWKVMRDTETDTLCTVSTDGDLLGLIALKDIANANLNVFDTEVLGRSNTPLKNIVSTLNGRLLLGNKTDCITTGSVCIGTSPEMMEEVLKPGDIVLVTNRYESQRFAVECKASCLVVCNDAHVSSLVIDAAESQRCAIIVTPHNTYAAARLISMAIPVRARMIDKNLVTVSVNTPIGEASKLIRETRHRFLPVVEEDGTYAGLIRSSNLLTARKKQVILVDHNERSQAVDDLEDSEIIEIIDHHRIGSIETDSPVAFRNMPVGCTCTIVYMMYREQDVEIPRSIAGIMLSAILSDTLAFRSPTCTRYDRDAAEALAAIAEVDIDAYADQMFEAGADLEGRSAEEVFYQDFKAFSRGNVRFGIGQGSYMTKKSRRAAEALLAPYLRTVAENESLPLVFFMFTDVKSASSELMWYGKGAETVVEAAFETKCNGDMAELPGVVSRKKQVVPALMASIESLMDE